MRRSDKQIVADANELAREFYGLMGYLVPPGHDFRLAMHPQEQMCWKMAVCAYERISGTDVENAVDNL